MEFWVAWLGLVLVGLGKRDDATRQMVLPQRYDFWRDLGASMLFSLCICALARWLWRTLVASI